MAGLTGLIESDILPIVAKSAPILASVLGSPIAGIALSLIASAFGVKSDDVSKLSDVLKSDPDTAFKLKQLELQHAEALATIASNNYQTEVDDRKDARERQVKLNDHVPTIIAILILLIYAGIQFCAIYSPSSADDIISARVQDVLVMIVSYYFGSSNKKTDEKNLK